MKDKMPVEAAIAEAEALVTVLKMLAALPDDESRARVMAMVSTECGFYEEAVEFNRAARAAEVYAAVPTPAELAGHK